MKVDLRLLVGLFLLSKVNTHYLVNHASPRTSEYAEFMERNGDTTQKNKSPNLNCEEILGEEGGSLAITRWRFSLGLDSGIAYCL